MPWIPILFWLWLLSDHIRWLLLREVLSLLFFILIGTVHFEHYIDYHQRFYSSKATQFFPLHNYFQLGTFSLVKLRVDWTGLILTFPMLSNSWHDHSTRVVGAILSVFHSWFPNAVILVGGCRCYSYFSFAIFSLSRRKN